jgi:hypothetical protein
VVLYSTLHPISIILPAHKHTEKKSKKQKERTKRTQKQQQK